MVLDHFKAYLELLNVSPSCGKARKKTRTTEFVDGLVENSGIAVLQLFRAYYDKHVAKKLCLEVLCGMK